MVPADAQEQEADFSIDAVDWECSMIECTHLYEPTETSPDKALTANSPFLQPVRMRYCDT